MLGYDTFINEINKEELTDSIFLINDFVNIYFLAQDARAFRKYAMEIQPDVDLTFYPEDGPSGGVRIPIGISFFWPDSGL